LHEALVLPFLPAVHNVVLNLSIYISVFEQDLIIHS